MSMVGITFEFPEWEEKLKKRLNEINLFIAAQMQTNRGMLFDAEGGYNGHQRWAPLKLRTGMILSKTGALRQSMGPMNMGGRPGPDGIVRFEGDKITIGTKLAYARLMNDGTVNMPGGVIRAKKGQALKIPVPDGVEINRLKKEIRSAKTDAEREEKQEKLEKWKELRKEGKGNDGYIFRKSVKIPARPFDTWTAEDEKELSTALANKLIEVLNE